MNNSDYKAEGMVLEDSIKITPDKVHEIIARNMLADGFGLVLDLKNSKGMHLVDERTGDSYLDLFTFFASSPLGLNHPRLHSKEVLDELAFVSVNKPSNSDIYTVLMAEFVDTFSKIAKPDYMKYLFFIAGGALAVENGLKAAFVDIGFEKNAFLLKILSLTGRCQRCCPKKALIIVLSVSFVCFLTSRGSS